MAVTPLILATRNAHKLAEVGRILEPFGLTVEGLGEHVALPPEDGETYAANSLGKARAAARSLGRDVIADDSGIEAEALDGRPGVRSARFAGEHASDAENLAKLIATAPAGSGLRYVCALSYVSAAGEERVFMGESRGRLGARPRGERGFGYDPAFLPDFVPAHDPGDQTEVPDGEALSMAELSDAQKDEISHRGRALRAFAAWRVRAG